MLFLLILTNLTVIRRKAEDTHKNVWDLTKQSLDWYEEMVRLYDGLKNLRKEEQSIADNLGQKTKFEQIQKELVEKQTRLNDLSKILHKEYKEERKRCG